MKIAVTIETKDRRLAGGENYLGRTLQNLTRAGLFSSPHLDSLTIVCGGAKPDFYGQEIAPHLARINPLYAVNYIKDQDGGTTRQQNAMRSIKYALEESPEADWVLKLEDDLDFLDDFLGNVARWLTDYGHANTPMLVLGATFQRVSDAHFQEGETFLEPGPSFPRMRKAYAQGVRFAPHAAQGWYAAQALLFTRRNAQVLVDWLGPDPALWDGKEHVRHRGHDLLLQVWAKEKMKADTFGVACPAFIQHIGRQSNLNQPEIGHTQPWFEFPFPGREWRYDGR